jgi:hypothetical protein
MRTVLLLLALLSPAAAQMDAVRRNAWAEAELAAARHSDPVAVKLVRFYRLLAGTAPAAETLGSQFTAPVAPAQLGAR